MTTQTCQTASRHLLAQAHEELVAGDTRQASQKGWTAAAQIVKSVAVRRGWAHHDHAALYNAISRLVAETGDDDIRVLFQVAISLEANFYENWDNAANVAGDLVDLELFLDKMEPLAAPDPARNG